MKRVISSIAALLILFAVALTPQVFLKLAVFFAAQIMIFEYNKAFSLNKYKLLCIPGHLACFILLFADSIKDHYFLMISILIIMYALILIKGYDKININDAAKSLFGIIYIVFLISFIIYTRTLDNGKWHIWFVFIGAWTVDTFAFLTGKLFGKRKIIPAISPKKTVAGCVGGFLAGIVFISIFGIIEKACLDIGVPIYQYMIMGALCGIFSQVGDLFASVMKRNAGLKDFGNIMPGHGGALDRLDSILLIAPLVYMYLNYVIIPLNK